MKKSVLLKSIIAVVVLIFTIEFSIAGGHDPKKANDLSMIMKKHVLYPDYAKENNLTGFVVVAFDIDNDGKIIISQINSNTSYFQDYVIEKLKEVVLKNPECYQDKTQYFRFDFQLLED